MCSVKVLKGLGVDVDFPKGQTCCGQPAFNNGFWDETRRLAKRMIRVFEKSEYVVAPSGSCVAMVKEYYPLLFEDDDRMKREAEELGKKCYEFADFLVNVLGVEDVNAHFEGKVTYHFSCHQRAIGLADESVRLIECVKGAEYIQMEGMDRCCGFGGAFSVRYPEISGAMLKDKTDSIAGCKAGVVIANDAGCMMNLAGGLKRRGIETRVMHIAELLVKGRGVESTKE